MVYELHRYQNARYKDKKKIWSLFLLVAVQKGHHHNCKMFCRKLHVNWFHGAQSFFRNRQSFKLLRNTLSFIEEPVSPLLQLRNTANGLCPEPMGFSLCQNNSHITILSTRCTQNPLNIVKMNSFFASKHGKSSYTHKSGNEKFFTSIERLHSTINN